MEDHEAPATTSQAAARTESQAAAIRDAEQRLHRRFDGAAGPAAVEKTVAEAWAHFDGSKVRSFIPILVERRAADALERLSRQGRGQEPDGPPGFPAGRPGGS